MTVKFTEILNYTIYEREENELDSIKITELITRQTRNLGLEAGGGGAHNEKF